MLRRPPRPPLPRWPPLYDGSDYGEGFGLRRSGPVVEDRLVAEGARVSVLGRTTVRDQDLMLFLAREGDPHSPRQPSGLARET